MKPKKVATLTAVLLAAGLTAGPALAITAGEVMDKMEPKQRSGFIAGAVDMASHLYAIGGNRKKADCAVKWLFDNEDSNREIHAFFDAHKDKDAVGILSILINRHCGK